MVGTGNHFRWLLVRKTDGFLALVGLQVCAVSHRAFTYRSKRSGDLSEVEVTEVAFVVAMLEIQTEVGYTYGLCLTPDLAKSGFVENGKR